MRIAWPGPQWRFLVSPRWLGWHLAVWAGAAGMLALGWWQFRRAVEGNPLSWAYTFEWPMFAGFALVFWVKTIRDEVHPPAASQQPASDAQLPATAARAATATGPGAGGGLPPGTAPAGEGPDGEDEDDEELAAYNAYLARLHQEARGHGKWHGLR